MPTRDNWLRHEVSRSCHIDRNSGRLRMAPDILNERCARSKTSAERDR